MNSWSATLVMMALGLPAAATTSAEQKGLEISVEADRRDMGWQDLRAELRMVLHNGHGQESRRVLRVQMLEIQGDGDKSLTVFDEPRDVKGTTLLSHSHPIAPDDQWLYLPALKRVKRIASANKSGPFVGSEFAYEDLTSQEVEKYRYRWLRDEPVSGREAYVIERIPNYEHSGYTRQVTWIDKSMYQPLRIDYYDRKGALLKTFTAHDFKHYLDRHWRPDRMEMVNHQTGKGTVLHWDGYTFGTGLSDRDFNRGRLSRAQ